MEVGLCGRACPPYTAASYLNGGRGGEAEEERDAGIQLLRRRMWIEGGGTGGKGRRGFDKVASLA